MSSIILFTPFQRLPLVKVGLSLVEPATNREGEAGTFRKKDFQQKAIRLVRKLSFY